MAIPYIGELRLVPLNFAPLDWAFCNGQLLAINQNQALFSLLGTTYGGDGIQTFALPNLQSRVALGAGGNYVLGQVGGAEAHTLTQAEMAPHTHLAACSSAAGNQAGVAAAVWASDAVHLDPPYRADAPNASMNPQCIQPTGGNQAHENMQPFVVLNWIIALFGVFPSRA